MCFSWAGIPQSPLIPEWGPKTRKVSLTFTQDCEQLEMGRSSLYLERQMLSGKNLHFSISFSFFRKKSPHSNFKTSFTREYRMKEGTVGSNITNENSRAVSSASQPVLRRHREERRGAWGIVAQGTGIREKLSRLIRPSSLLEHPLHWPFSLHIEAGPPF